MSEKPFEEMLGQDVQDRSGADIGQVEHVYADGDDPVWVATGDKLVPLADARSEGDAIRVAVDRSTVDSAPGVKDPSHLEQDEQEAVFQHYSGALGGAKEERGRTEPSEAGESNEAVETTEAGEGKPIDYWVDKGLLTMPEEELEASRERAREQSGEQSGGQSRDQQHDGERDQERS